MQEIPQDKVRAQLERVLESTVFHAGKKLSLFLRYAVEQKLKGHSNQLKQYSIAVNALGYQPDFDPRDNPTVRIMARRLRRKLDNYYRFEGSGDPIRIDLPKGGYSPVFSLNSGAEAGAYSPSGPASFTADAAKNPESVPGGPSVATLPFKFLGNEFEYNFIASGLAEEITIALTRFQDFFVVGPLSREVLRNGDGGTRAIREAFKVRFVLDGTMRLNGKTLRLSNTLTDTLNDRKLWGQLHEFDIEATSLKEVEQEIVGRVVATIADNFGVIPRTMAREVLHQQDESLSDYAAILRFHHHVRVLSEESLAEAVEALESVVQRDPRHDLAMALLADLIATPYWLGYTDDRYDLGRATELAKRALTMNPSSQPAHVSMAICHFMRSEKALCVREIEQALDLNPNNANYLANSALFLMGTGDREKAMALITKAMRWNPHHPGWYHIVPFFYHYYRGEYGAALADAEGFNNPDYFWDPLIRAAVLAQLGRVGEAKEAGAELMAQVPDFELRGHSLIQRMVLDEECTGMLLDGLRKAGLSPQ